MAIAIEDGRKAIVLAISAAIILPAGDAIVKLLVLEYPLLMVAWVRFGIMALVLGTFSWPQQGWLLFRPKALRLQFVRALMAVIAIVMFFRGLQTLPLAECIAISFVYPILTTFIARSWLGELPSTVVWVGMFFSFIGVVLIVKPGNGILSADALYPLASATALAFYLVITRKVAVVDDPRVTTFFGAFVAFLLFSPLMAQNVVAVSSAVHVQEFIAVGALAALGQYLVSLAYRYGPTQLVAPFGYLTVVASVGLGWLIFGVVPEFLPLMGISIIILTGGILAMRSG